MTFSDTVRAPVQLTRICCQCRAHLGGPHPRLGFPITHGFCPECARKQLEDIEADAERWKKKREEAK